MHFQWYPGHMTKARRMMQENITDDAYNRQGEFIELSG